MRLIGDFLCLLLSVYIRFLYFGHRVSQNRGQATKRKWKAGAAHPCLVAAENAGPWWLFWAWTRHVYLRGLPIVLG